jgi:IS30 family transposase
MSSSNNSNDNSNTSNNKSTSRPGRPRALNEVKRREICALVSVGCSLENAARYVGCVPSTIRREARRNREFSDELRRASFTAEITPLQALREAARKYWRAAAWLLERIDPERFGRQDPGHVKPHELRAYTQMIVDILKDEITDPAALDRVTHRLVKLQKSAQRETWANRNTTPSPPRRKRQTKPFEYPPDFFVGQTYPDGRPVT